MHREQLQAFQTWFNHYVKTFYSEDPVVQGGIDLKEKHTWRVCENIIGIGRSINLGDGDLHLAEAVALFHDIGRFRQFAHYRTFNDRRSENHALLGLKELELAGVLSPLAAEERYLINKAIEYHNLCDLPRTVPERCLLFARLIRDADKLDILEMFTASTGLSHESGRAPAFGHPHTPGYSPVLVENLLCSRSCSYENVSNRNDRTLLQLSWIYDINFSYTLSQIALNGYLKKMIHSLPDTKDIQAVHDHLQTYLNRRQARTER